MSSNEILIDLAEAKEHAELIKKELQEVRVRTMICGSIRRVRPVVHDIDMVVGCSLDKLRDILKDLCHGGEIEYEIMTKNRTPKKYDCLINRLPYNFYFAEGQHWVAMVLFLTGSQLFNILIRGEAKKQGLKLSQYGLFHGSEIIAGKTEKQIFMALGLEYVKPANREVDNKFKFRRV